MDTPAFDVRSLIDSVELAGLNRAGFARLAGVDRSTLSRLEHGEIRRPSFETVTKLQNAVARVSLMQQSR
jgi:transcriptional regulator with XRE-family HTH domain